VETNQVVFQWVLAVLAEKKLLKGMTNRRHVQKARAWRCRCPSKSGQASGPDIAPSAFQQYSRLVIPTNELFLPDARTSDYDLHNAPYAGTNLHLTEVATFGRRV
jgi:hypothetical protein